MARIGRLLAGKAGTGRANLHIGAPTGTMFEREVRALSRGVRRARSVPRYTGASRRPVLPAANIEGAGGGRFRARLSSRGKRPLPSACGPLSATRRGRDVMMGVAVSVRPNQPVDKLSRAATRGPKLRAHSDTRIVRLKRG